MSVGEVSIEVCHECPMRCIMCSSQAKYPEPIKDVLSLDEIKQIIYHAFKMKASYISLSGGEPTQRKDIIDIIKYCKRYKLNILYYTSGCFTKNGTDVEPLPEKLLHELYISGSTLIFDVQSHKKHIHDKIMGIKGAYDTMIQSLEKAIKMGINVETHFVPQKLNINDIEEYILWLDGIGVKKVSFLRLVPQGRVNENYDDVMITKRQFKDLQYTFCDITKENGLDIKIRLGHPIDRRWMLYPDEFPIKTCRGGDQAPLIKPNGFVDMCPAFKDLQEYSAGNIRINTLPYIWEHSDFYKTFRWYTKKGYKQVENECRDCKYLSKCKCGCTAQRLLLLSDDERRHMTFRDALLKAPSDPMCLFL